MNDVVEITPSMMFNFQRPHDYSRRTRLEIEQKIERYKKAIVLWPAEASKRRRLGFDWGTSEAEVKDAINKLNGVIAYYENMLRTRAWEG